jgi:FkbM family methyltransferase
MLFTSFEKFIDVRKGAIHVGAHEGQERFWYQRQGFNKVLWFEPNVEIYPTLVKNIEAFKEHKAYNVGIHDTINGKTSLHVSNNSESSSILEFGTHQIYAPQVVYIKDMEIELVRMDEFLKQEQIDIGKYNFLNIDVQGVELNVIKSFGKLISKMDYLYLEVNEEELYVGCSLLPDIDSYVKKFGFLRMATHMTKCKWGDAFYKKYA